MSLGPSEVIVVLVVALLVLGPDKLPQAARSMAKVYRDFRKVSDSFRSQVESALDLDIHEKASTVDQEVKPANPDLGGFELVDKPPTLQDPVPQDPKTEDSE